MNVKSTFRGLVLFAVLFYRPLMFAQDSGLFQIARVQYQGGGDWYNDPSAVPNLCKFIKEQTRVPIHSEEAQISIMDEGLFNFPFLFLTGHGRWTVQSEEVERWRQYLTGGGFLYVDDDYGLDASFHQVMKTLFPSKQLKELPFDHPIYHCQFVFSGGLPKIHEHDNKSPQGLGLFDDSGRLMVFYTYETNLSDGWADPDVHHDPPNKRLEALKMGTNIVIWSMLQ